MPKKILIAEGNPASRNEGLHEAGIEYGAERYAQEVLRMFPDTEIAIVCPADHKACLPSGVGFGDVDGLFYGGGGLHIFDKAPEVTQQIDFMRAALASGVSVLGSCWGLQVGVVAAGGMVAANPKGREVGFARDITLNDAGKSHPMFAGKKPVFDSPCIHYDETTGLPPGAEVLASNGHSDVQAVSIKWGGGRFWGVQYHPEFDMKHLADLYGRFSDEMIGDGFFDDEAGLAAHVSDMRTLHEDPSNAAAREKLAATDDVLDPDTRCIEIRNWLESLPQRL